MAVNPMQRKANNSFLLGMLITLLITGVIIAFLIMQIAKFNKEKEETDAQIQYAYVITSEVVKSGTEITGADVKGIELKSGVNSGIVYSAQTKDAQGNPKADETGLLFPAGLKAKVDLHPGTIVTSDLIYEDEPVANDVRTQEYNVITLISQLTTGDYIDVRLRLPSGQDYIVVSHKQLTIPIDALGMESSNCIWLNLDEEETLMMSSAIIDTYRAEGAMLYATKYVEPGIQTAATQTYLPSQGVMQQLQQNPNILAEAKQAIINRYNTEANRKVNRDPINSAINNDEADDNVKSGVTQEVQGLQEEREKYLESLGM